MQIMYDDEEPEIHIQSHHQTQQKHSHQGAKSKLWADYLCNSTIPYSYTGTIHHPEHFKFVPGAKTTQVAALSTNGMNENTNKRHNSDQHHHSYAPVSASAASIGQRRTVKRQRIFSKDDNYLDLGSTSSSTISSGFVRYQQQQQQQQQHVMDNKSATSMDLDE